MGAIAASQSFEERMKHLELANNVRIQRACLKRRLKTLPPAEAGFELATLIGTADTSIASMRVNELLLAVPRIGVEGSRRMRVRAGRGFTVSPDAKVEDLNDGCRERLASELRKFALRRTR